MIRVVLAVVLATALVGVGMGALERARPERTGRLVDAEVDRLADAAADLQRSEPAVARRSLAARRHLFLDVSDGGFVASPVDYVAIGGLPGRPVPGDDASGDVVAYRIAGGEPVVRRLPVDLRAAGPTGLLPDDQPLVLRGPADLTLSLLRRGGRRLVAVARGTPHHA